LEDGNIEFLGRMDDQVKVRGFRIETGEIENHLLKHPAVKEAAVIAHPFGQEKNENQLAAYFILFNREISFTVPGLRVYLADILPDYMIPSYFIQLEQLPLTPNGKIDKKALSRLGKDGLELKSGVEYTPPRDETEEHLISIWKNVLGIEKISINDNFFHLGGHSLKAMRLTAEISQKTGKEIPLAQIYQTPTIAQLAEFMTHPGIRDILEKEKFGIVFNSTSTSSKTIFAFPPLPGYGMVFSGLAEILKTYWITGFHFVEAKNPIHEYTSHITRVIKERDVILLGYSAGGNLAFNVAKALEKQGKTVSNLIILDAMPRVTLIEKPFLIEENQEAVETFLGMIGIRDRNTLDFQYLKPPLYKKLENYYNYFAGTLLQGKISASIHVIKAADSHAQASKWSGFTRGEVFEYQGFGSHHFMLSEAHAAPNTELIEGILKDSDKKNSCRNFSTVV
jgi:thioesterase domain-containing protein/acyl carrier protein